MEEKIKRRRQIELTGYEFIIERMHMQTEKRYLVCFMDWVGRWNDGNRLDQNLPHERGFTPKNHVTKSAVVNRLWNWIVQKCPVGSVVD